MKAFTALTVWHMDKLIPQLFLLFCQYYFYYYYESIRIGDISCAQNGNLQNLFFSIATVTKVYTLWMIQQKCENEMWQCLERNLEKKC